VGILDRLRSGLARTREGISARLGGLFSQEEDLPRGPDPEIFYPALEEILIGADVGAGIASELAERVRERLKGRAPHDTAALKGALREEIRAMEGAPASAAAAASAAPSAGAARGPRVIFLVGVNGGGKTTTAAKIAHLLTAGGGRGVIAAADTFRAAAIAQIETWARRVGVDLIRHHQGADASAVVFDALKAARARGSDFVVVDTAGRLHTKAPLMKELEKLYRIAGREVEGAPHESLLVVDATTGQNGIAQAREFLKAGKITGLVLTKLDGTARGGVAIGISRQLGIPLRYVGVGESVEDLLPFSLSDYLDGILGDASSLTEGGAPPSGA
jgi:fused signal recognition particle receptor